MAANATFALKPGVWFLRVRFVIFAPDSRREPSPPSGRKSTQPTVQILEASSHLMRPRRLAQQFAAASPNIATKHRVTVLGYPHQVVLAVPDRVAATLVRFHPPNLHRKRRHPAA